MPMYVPSLLDRLTDADLEPNRWKYSLNDLKAAILRDLKDLLNTKRIAVESFIADDLLEQLLAEQNLNRTDAAGVLEQVFPRVNTSIAQFGLRDATHLEASSEESLSSYAKHLELVITLFEPRLTSVHAEHLAPEDVKASRGDRFRIGSAYFRIRATLNVEQAPRDDLILDTSRDLATGEHDIESADGVAI